MARRRTPRDAELSTRPAIAKRAEEIAEDVEKAFRDQRERVDDQLDYWDIYNCKLGEKQAYNGNSRLFVPIVHNAVDARKTRFSNQVFPKSGRYVEVVSENGDIPHAETALLEHYVRKAKLRTKVAPSLNRNGDIEGQYNVYVFWRSTARHVVWKDEEPIKVNGVDLPEDVGAVETIQADVINDGHPDVEVLSDADVVVWPATVDTIEDAFEEGGGCAIIRRWSKARIRQLIKDGEIPKDVGDRLIKSMNDASRSERTDVRKEHADAAGIKDKGKWFLAYEAWAKLKVDGELRLCRLWLGAGAHKVLGVKQNPYWSDKCPLISAPVEKVAGVFKGQSKVAPVADLQYYANDILNEGADSATYAMLPITMTDPLKNPKISTMVLSLGAVWETSPNDTQFAKFPQMWQDAVGIVGQIKSEIFQTLSVNPAMIPQSTGQAKQKRSQAEIANEQAVDILTTADSVTAQEEGIWTPIIERFAELDAQFRSSELTVRAYGYMGQRLKMEKIPPLQLGRRWEFRWFGVEAARNAADIQGKIAGMNVLRGIPPALLPGRKLNFVPLVEALVSDQYGARMAPLIFEDTTRHVTLDPETENGMLREGFQIPVSPFDNDPEHIQAHLAEMRAGDPQGVVRQHIMAHQAQMAAKGAQAQAAESSPGTPGGAGPGIAGQPRPGAQPTAPRQGFGPPGLIRPDNLPAAGAVPMPRKM